MTPSVDKQAVDHVKRLASAREEKLGESSLPLRQLTLRKGGCELNLFKTLPRLLGAHNVYGCFSESLVMRVDAGVSSNHVP